MSLEQMQWLEKNQEEENQRIRNVNGVYDRLYDKDFVLHEELPHVHYVYEGDVVHVKHCYQHPNTKEWWVELGD